MKLTLPDANLYYETHPAKSPEDSYPPLMLVAGLGSDSLSWLPVLERLRQQRDIITLDNRGSGRTEARTGISLAQMANDCLALADHLGIEQVDLAGHSMGGMIAMHVAHRAPERIRRLVLCNTTAMQSKRNERLFDDWVLMLEQQGASQAWYRGLFYWLLNRQFFEDQDTLQQLLKLVVNYEYAPDSVAYRNQVDAIRGFDARSLLADIKTPSLVLASSEDLLFPPGEDAAGLAALPNASVEVVPGLAHSLTMQAPEHFVRSVLTFLDH